MNDDTIEGTFQSPTRPQQGEPRAISIAGKGQLRMTREALVAHGFKPRVAWLLLATTGIFIGAAALGAGWLVCRYLTHSAFTATAVGPAIIAAALAMLATPRGSSRTPVEIAMPWSTIRGIAVAKDHLGAPVLHVLSDEQIPMRAIYFRPADLDGAIRRLDAARNAR